VRLAEKNELERALANAGMLIFSWGVYRDGRVAGELPWLNIDGWDIRKQ
jgi:hypothetical protein